MQRCVTCWHLVPLEVIQRNQLALKCTGKGQNAKLSEEDASSCANRASSSLNLPMHFNGPEGDVLKIDNAMSQQLSFSLLNSRQCLHQHLLASMPPRTYIPFPSLKKNASHRDALTSSLFLLVLHWSSTL